MFPEGFTVVLQNQPRFKYVINLIFRMLSKPFDNLQAGTISRHILINARARFANFMR